MKWWQWLLLIMLGVPVLVWGYVNVVNAKQGGQ